MLRWMEVGLLVVMSLSLTTEAKSLSHDYSFGLTNQGAAAELGQSQPAVTAGAPFPVDIESNRGTGIINFEPEVSDFFN